MGERYFEKWGIPLQVVEAVELDRASVFKALSFSPRTCLLVSTHHVLGLRFILRPGTALWTLASSETVSLITGPGVS